jgi:DnaJ-class molecular chaperone
MKNYYSILGINKNASEEDIKQSYRKLAREHHPDKGGDKNLFQEIQEAYETLSDSNKKQQYDYENSQNFGNGIPFNFPFFSFNFNNSSNRKHKRQNHIHDITISMNDVYNGLTKRFKISKKSICLKCHQICQLCNGNGNITKHMRLGPLTQIINEKCNICNGSGQTRSTQINCNDCNSTGLLTIEQLVEINIPKGVEENKTYLFESWGEQPQNTNELPGDLLVRIKIHNDTLFERSGLDLIYKSNISLRDLIIGKNIIIPHFNNTSFDIHTRGFGIINPNKQYTIYNKGLRDNSNNQGNLHLHFVVDFPNRNFNQHEIDIITNAFNQINF